MCGEMASGTPWRGSHVHLQPHLLALTKREWEQWHGSAFFLPILGGQVLLARSSLSKTQGESSRTCTHARPPRSIPADCLGHLLQGDSHNQVLLAGLSLQQDCTLWVVVTAIRSLPQHGSTVIASCEPKDGFSLTNFRLLFVHCAKVCIGPIYSEK